jgi:hypothetical protein
MNWHIFSIFGYLGVALWLSVPLLWLAYGYRQQPWLRYLATALTLAAFVCAKVNSSTHVNRIQTIPAAELKGKGNRQEEIRQAALDGRSAEVAQISFAEDAQGEFLDKAGMDEADLKYLGNAGKSAIPEWQKQKKNREQGAAQDASPEENLDAQIGGADATTGVDVGLPDDPTKNPPLRMSEADVATANRLDRWNLNVTRFLILAAVLILAVDYLRRANNYAHASLPLRLPSAWLNSLTPMPPLVVRPKTPRRSIPAELEWLARRGDSFIYLTDNPGVAKEALAHLETQPKRHRPEVVRVADGISDGFVFESLWFGRGSFIVDSAARAESMLTHFISQLELRRTTRAQVTQTAHVVWDVSSPVPEITRETFVKLAAAAGLQLFLCHASPSTN